MVQLTQELLGKLSEAGLEVLHGPGAHVPEDVVFEPPCSIKWMHIHHSLKMGAFSYAVRGFYFNVEIGRYTSIGEDVQIGRGDHPTDWVSTSPAFYISSLFRTGDDFEQSAFYKSYHPKIPSGKVATVLKKTVIGHDVYIGHGAFIRPGITIGNGAIVGAYAVVVKDVPPYAVVAGNPAVVKKYRFSDDLIQKFQALNWWRFAPWDLAMSVDMTSPQNAVTELSQVLPTLSPYSPKERRLKEFLK